MINKKNIMVKSNLDPIGDAYRAGYNKGHVEGYNKGHVEGYNKAVDDISENISKVCKIHKLFIMGA